MNSNIYSLEVPTFEERNGLNAFMIAPTAIIRGTGITFNMEIFEVEGTTGYYNSNLNNKSRKAIELI